MRLSLQPTASCHLLFSLVIEFDARRPDLDTLVQTIKRSKFAGGHILEFGKIQDFNDAEDALVLD